jgi:hypothetical protein
MSALNHPPIQQSSNPTTQLAKFSSWCPKLIAAIGRLPDTLANRCIVIRMQRNWGKAGRVSRARDAYSIRSHSVFR